MLFLMIARVVDGTPMEQLRSLVKPEAAKVWEYYAADRVKSVYYFANMGGAVLMYDATSLAEVEAAAAELPMVKAGVLTLEIIPLKPYVGLETLFAQ
ncbi:MAG: hypothetical protein SFY66_12105 [Oculatellaceae cyanobacterium bins.114]|nr:hypothetical protein [Oculatellaceae cyanobacterium bins.114]